MCGIRPFLGSTEWLAAQRADDFCGVCYVAVQARTSGVLPHLSIVRGDLRPSMGNVDHTAYQLDIRGPDGSPQVLGLPVGSALTCLTVACATSGAGALP